MRNSAFALLPVLALAVVAVCFCARARGQSPAFMQVLPASAAGVEGAASTALPLGSTLSRHVQYAYDGSAVGYSTPVRIQAIRLRCDGAAPGASVNGAYSFLLDVSTSNNPADGLSTTFADNHGADRIRVRSGSLNVIAPPVGSMPNEFRMRIPFDVPFDWDPRNGPLLVDFIYQSGTPAFAAWDAVSGAVGGVAAVGAFATTATSVLTTAPVLQLELQSDVLPDSLADTEGSVGSSYPWGIAAGSRIRTLNIFDAAALPFAGRQRITALAWRTDGGAAAPARTMTTRISLSTSSQTAATIDTTFANNHGSDLTVVFEGELTITASPASTDLGQFDVFCELQRPFEYDPGQGSLAIDMQVFSASGAVMTCDATSMGQSTARVTHSTSATATVANQLPQHYVLVTGMRSVPVPTVPSASSGTTNQVASSSGAYPFAVDTARHQLLVSAADAGIVAPFVVRHLRFRPSYTQLQYGPSTFALTIDMSHSPLSPNDSSGTYADQIGADVVRVFDGVVSVPFGTRTADDIGFPIQIKLQRPFAWWPSLSQYLTVDIRVLSRSGEPIDIETTVGVPADDANAYSLMPDALIGGKASSAPVLQLGGDGQNGLATTYGPGCMGTNGEPWTATVGLPTLPNPDFQVRIRQALGNSAAVFFAGFTPIRFELPGAPGCNVLHAAEVGILGFTVTDPSGDGVVPLPLANDITMEGLEFQTQWIVLDPTANASGLVTSSAQGLTARFF